MSRIDLHMHSAYSDDGEFSIEELIKQCGADGIEIMAVTDHNSVKGVGEAVALGGKMGIRAVSGIELDCVHMGRNFHLLGYGFDYSLPVFGEIERNILKQEQSAAKRKIALIKRETGIPLVEAEVLAASPNGVVTGELIAEILLNREDAGEYGVLLPYLSGGSRDDNPYVNFYWDYFSAGKPAYVQINYISLSEAVSIIHGAGGIAVLAHPGQNLKGDYAFLRQLIESGIDGLEAYSSYHSASEAACFDTVAEKSGLLVTCGSDFHGKTKPAIALCGHGAGDRMPAIAAAFLQQVGGV